jgi:hypothetical protein
MAAAAGFSSEGVEAKAEEAQAEEAKIQDRAANVQTFLVARKVWVIIVWA